MKTTNDQGKLQSAVISLYFFLKKFIPEFVLGQVIVIDGSPRSEKEFELWQSLIDFEYIPESYVINIDVSDLVCIERLKNRPGRTDTLNMESLREKLAWYAPVREILKNPPQGFQVINIDGELSAEDVFSQIKKEMEIVLKG